MQPPQQNLMKGQWIEKDYYANVLSNYKSSKDNEQKSLLQMKQGLSAVMKG